MAKNKYSDCFYCGGVVVERLMPRELRWGSRLFIFENVPMGVCAQCGEKFLVPKVAKSIDKMLRRKGKPTKTVQVPVYQYKPDVA